MKKLVQTLISLGLVCFLLWFATVLWRCYEESGPGVLYLPGVVLAQTIIAWAFSPDPPKKD